MGSLITEETLQNQQRTKQINLNRLTLARKESPDEVTQKEISLVKDLHSTCHTYQEEIDLLRPTVSRTTSVEQVESLMDFVYPRGNYEKFWVDTFHSLEDNEKDRNLGKNIIQAAAKKASRYNNDDDLGLIKFYSFLLKESYNEKAPESLIRDSAMISEMFKGLNTKLQMINEQGEVCPRDIMDTRRFLSPYTNDALSKVFVKKGNKNSLKENYQNLLQTVHHIQNAELEKQQMEDKRTMDELFGLEKNIQVINKDLDITD